jgi:hypothetical protein
VAAHPEDGCRAGRGRGSRRTANRRRRAPDTCGETAMGSGGSGHGAARLRGREEEGAMAEPQACSSARREEDSGGVRRRSRACARGGGNRGRERARERGEDRAEGAGRRRFLSSWGSFAGGGHLLGDRRHRRGHAGACRYGEDD